MKLCCIKNLMLLFDLSFIVFHSCLILQLQLISFNYQCKRLVQTLNC